MKESTMPTFPAAAITTSIGDMAGNVAGLITSNLPVILGVTAAFVGLSVAKRFIRTLAS